MFSATSIHVVPFDPTHAATIASWVRDDEMLRWVSPSTSPPLTPDKVRGWPRPDGKAFVLAEDEGRESAAVLAYSELNRMQSGIGNWWIGHFIVDPAHRGRGLGQLLLRSILEEAFDRLEANTVCLVVFPDNQPAIRCYESGGFKRIRTEYYRFASHAHRVRLVRYEITSDAWRQSRTR